MDITTAQAAEILGKHPRTVRRYIADELLNSKRLANGLILLDDAEVRRAAAIIRDEAKTGGVHQ